jgi:hypothetical protein
VCKLFPTFTYSNADFRTSSSEMNHLKIPLPEDAPQANRAVNLPPFWTNNQQSWFTSAEGAFRLRNIANWVANFGMPATVTTDWGAQFTPAVWTGAFHPAWASSTCSPRLTTLRAIGWFDGVHRQIKDALRARGAGSTWHSHLPWVLMGRLRRILLSLQQSWSMGHHSSSLASYCTDPPRVDTPSPGGPRVRASWWPAESSGGPICQPLPGGLQGGQDVHHPGGPEGRR